MSDYTPSRRLCRTIATAMRTINGFKRLPTELLLMIAEQLDLSSIHVLSLCNLQMQKIFGILPPLVGHDKRVFLAAVTKDLPNIYRCEVCSKFHPSLFGPTCDLPTEVELTIDDPVFPTMRPFLRPARFFKAALVVKGHQEEASST